MKVKHFWFASLVFASLLSACGGGSSSGGDVSDTTPPMPPAPEPPVSASIFPLDYRLPAPENGKLKGVVELGAASFKSLAVNLDEKKRWVLTEQKFVDLPVAEGAVKEEEIDKGLKEAIQFLKDSQVPGSNIHFVVSSGAKDEAVVVNAMKLLKKQGYNVNVVSAEDEGRYAFTTTVPPDFAGKAFMVDIGSGNTKISYRQVNGKVMALETLGAKYYTKSETDEVAYQRVKLEVQAVPTELQQVCFIIGGIPYNLARAAGHDKEKNLFTRLKMPSEYKEAEADKKDAAKAKAGLNIYRSIAENTTCKEFVFVDGTFFSIGFLLNLPY